MAITYPRAMPFCGVLRCDFDLDLAQFTGGEAGGRIITSEIAPAHWRMRFEHNPRTEADYDAWTAWLDSLKGASKLFYGRDLRRGKWPRAYRNTGFADLVRAGGSTPFDGTSTAIDLTNSGAPEISGLPAGFEVSLKDYVGFTWGSSGARTLHRFTEAGVADIDGNIALALEPEVPIVVPNDAVATFAAPTCLMKIVPGTKELSASFASNERSVSFEAIQQIIA